MITLIPAIDIIDGKCVRLTKGDYGSKTVYSGSPVDIAKMFEQAGMKRLHVVDLDGAKSRHVVNVDVLRSITLQTGLEVDFGGGIKTDDDIMKAMARAVRSRAHHPRRRRARREDQHQRLARRHG